MLLIFCKILLLKPTTIDQIYQKKILVILNMLMSSNDFFYIFLFKFWVKIKDLKKQNLKIHYFLLLLERELKGFEFLDFSFKFPIQSLHVCQLG
jgi:hypothetical protein